MAKFQPQRAAYPIQKDMYRVIPDWKVLPGVYQQMVDDDNLPANAEGLKVELPKGRLYHKTPASFNDPISVVYVLDALLKVPRGHYVRPSYLVPILTDDHPQMYWSANVVGRILAGIHVVCDEEYGMDGYTLRKVRKNAEDGSEHREVNDEKWLPFANGRDSKGKYYVIDPQGGNEGLLWLARMRENAYKAARALMVAEAAGDFEPEGVVGSGVVANEFIGVLAPPPIRTPTGYQSQTHYNRQFSYVQPEPRDGDLFDD